MIHHHSIAAAAVLALALAGCADEQRGQASVTTSLESPANAPLPRMPMAPVALKTQADFDALEQRHLGRQRPDELLLVYERLAEGRALVEDPAAVLLMQRWARLLVDRISVPADRTQGIELADTLYRTVPDSPHTYYLQGYIARKFLISAAGERALVVSDGNTDTARVLVDRWKKLLAVAPDYIGPDGHSALEITEDVAAVEAALARNAAAKPPEEGPAASATLAGPLALKAAIHLDGFEHGDDGERRTLCRERREDKLEGGASLSELRIDLSCALFEGRGADAVGYLERLAAAGASIAGCRTVARIADTGYSDAAVLERTRRAFCPEP